MDNVTQVKFGIATEADKTMIGGSHYKNEGLPDHWTLVHMYGWDYYTGAITKYLMRWKRKDGVKDLRKAQHFLQKYIELAELSEVFLEATKDKPVVVPLDKAHTFEKGEITPTGWVQYVFEGANAEGYLYTCRQCDAKFYAPPQTNPHAVHACHRIASSAKDGDATAAYVNQG